MMSVTRLTFGRRDADLVQRPPTAPAGRVCDMGQREILLVTDANFAEGIFVRRDRDRVHLIACGIPAAAHRLERQPSRSHSPAPCVGATNSLRHASKCGRVPPSSNSSGICGSFRKPDR